MPAASTIIDAVADGIRLQAGDVPGTHVPTLLKAGPAAYVVGFTAGVTRALGGEVGNATIRHLERGCRQGLPRQGDVGQRLADIATRLLLSGGPLIDDDRLVAIRESAEAEGRAYVTDDAEPTGLKDLLYDA